MAKGPETRLVKKILVALREAYPGSYWRKIHGNAFQHAGIPDILGCVKRRFIALEVKTEDENQRSKIQENEEDEILEARGIYGCVTSPEEAVECVKQGLIQPRVSKDARLTNFHA